MSKPYVIPEIMILVGSKPAIIVNGANITPHVKVYTGVALATVGRMLGWAWRQFEFGYSEQAKSGYQPEPDPHTWDHATQTASGYEPEPTESEE